jgi:hypothetical protein
VAVTDSAATSLESALATRTFDECNDTTTARQMGVVVNPDTAPIDASSNTRVLSRFIVEVSEPEEEKYGWTAGRSAQECTCYSPLVTAHTKGILPHKSRQNISR